MTCSGSSAATSVTKSHAPASRHRVDDAARPLSGCAASARVQDLRREAHVDQAAVLRVPRRIHVEHDLALRDQLLLGERRDQRAAALGRERLLVERDPPHVGVAGDRPEAAAVHAVGMPGDTGASARRRRNVSCGTPRGEGVGTGEVGSEGTGERRGFHRDPRVPKRAFVCQGPAGRRLAAAASCARMRSGGWCGAVRDARGGRGRDRDGGRRLRALPLPPPCRQLRPGRAAADGAGRRRGAGTAHRHLRCAARRRPPPPQCPRHPGAHGDARRCRPTTGSSSRCAATGSAVT